MNLQKLFETQKALDEEIVKKKGLEGADFLPQKILALQVELAECANEWRAFKFWSNNQKPNIDQPLTLDRTKDTLQRRNPLLEEYVDCLHFILSIGLDIKFDLTYLEYKVKLDQETNFYEDLTAQFIWTGNTITNLYDYSKQQDEEYELLFFEFIALGKMLGFTLDQVEQAYYDKNKINHQRQANGY